MYSCHDPIKNSVLEECTAYEAAHPSGPNTHDLWQNDEITGTKSETHSCKSGTRRKLARHECRQVAFVPPRLLSCPGSGSGLGAFCGLFKKPKPSIKPRTESWTYKGRLADVRLRV